MVKNLNLVLYIGKCMRYMALSNAEQKREIKLGHCI